MVSIESIEIPCIVAAFPVLNLPLAVPVTLLHFGVTENCNVPLKSAFNSVISSPTFFASAAAPVTVKLSSITTSLDESI